MKNYRKQRVIGVGAVLISAISFAAASVLQKKVFILGFQPIEVLAFQYWFASLVLIILTVIFSRDILKLSKRTFFYLGVQGLIGTLGSGLLIAYSILLLPVSVAILLLYLYPAFVYGISIIFSHRGIRRNEVIALIITFVGIFLTSGVLVGPFTLSVIGITVGVASALSFALLNILGEICLKEASPFAALSVPTWFASIGMLLYIGPDIMRFPWDNILLWSFSIALAILARLFPFYFLLLGIKNIGARKASIISTLELPLTFILASIFVGELPAYIQLVGGGLVFLGVAFINWIKDEQPRPVKTIQL